MGGGYPFHYVVPSVSVKSAHLKWPITFVLRVSSDLFESLGSIQVSVNPDTGREVLTLLVLVGDLLFLSTPNSAGET